jgi:nicotinamidase-related amidase
MHNSGQGRAPSGERAKFEIIDQLKPLPGEVFIRKSSPSAFWGTYLVSHLISQKIDTLVVVGESTSGCVRASVVDGRTHGYRMIVVEDCVFDRTEASHAINLYDMHQKYADVVTLEYAVEQVRAWQARKGNALRQPAIQTE